MDILNLFSLNQELTLRKLLIFSIIGLVSGFVRELVVNDNIVILPTRWEASNGKKAGVDLGIIGAMITSWFVAVMVNHSYRLAGVAAIAGPHLIEGAIKKINSYRLSLYKKADSANENSDEAHV